MGSINRRLGRNVFWSILLLAIFPCTLFSTSAFCEDIPTPTQAEQDFAQAEVLRKAKNFAEAKPLYLAVSQNSSDSELTIKSLRMTALCQARLGDFTAAVQTFEKIKADYSAHPKLYENIYSFGHIYLNLKKYDKASDVYQYVFVNSSDTDLKFNAQVKFATCQIRSGNDTAVDQAIAVLRNNFAQHPQLFLSVLSLAKENLKLSKISKAKALYQYVFQNSSENGFKLKGLVGLTDCEVKSGNYSSAEQALGQLTGFTGQNGFDYEFDTLGTRHQLALHNVEVGEFAKVENFVSDFIKTLSDRDIIAESDISYHRVTDPNLPRKRIYDPNSSVVELKSIGGSHPFRYVFPVLEAIYKKGNKELSEGKLDKASEYYKKTIKLGRLIDNRLPAPKKYLSAEVCIMVAECYRHEGEYKRAIMYLKKAIHKWPDNQYVPQAEFILKDCYKRLGRTRG